ncbi:MAG: two-component regulator propeller domain-containing protein [Paludibacter sp.]|nr:two-component regulator propeller domain-containing protein [Paludibacter sp.]
MLNTRHTIILLLCFLNPFFSWGTEDVYKFEKFFLNHKLPSGSVFRIFDDSDGYIWLGTTDGLCRFDGYDLKIFRSSSQTLGILKNNEIQCMTEDRFKHIWVGLHEGVNIIDKENYQTKEFNNKFVNKDRINSMLTDYEGNVWIATSSNGILRVNPKTLEYERYSTDKSSKLAIKSNSIINLYEDREGRIWFSSWRNGLGFISKNRDKVTYAPSIGINNNPFRVYQEKNGAYLVCSWGDGVFNMSVDSNSIVISPIKITLSSSQKSISNIVYSITQDDQFGYIWLLSQEGISILQKSADGQYQIVNKENFLPTAESILFHDIYKDKRGNLWLGSISEGAYSLQFKTSPIRYYPLLDVNTTKTKQSNVTITSEAKNHTLQIFINNLGVFNLDLVTGKSFSAFRNSSENLKNVFTILNPIGNNETWITCEGENFIRVYRSDADGYLSFIRKISLDGISKNKENTIIKLFQDSHFNIWIGTYEGLFIYNKNGSITKVPQNLKSVNSFAEDKNNNVWVGTDNDGFFKLTYKVNKNNTTLKCVKVPLLLNSYESVNVRNVFCSSDGKVYAGTKEGCIFVVNMQGQLSEISGVYGITEENIQSFCEDNFGFLWIVTSKKVIRYNPQNHTSIYFTNADGIEMTTLYKGNQSLTTSGYLLIGGNSGICTIDIKQLKHTLKAKPNHVFITDIFIQNKSLFNPERLAEYNPSQKRITAKYKNNNIRIEFSTLNYTISSKIQYAYKLSSINKEWIYTGNDNRSVNYTNLPDGKYTFTIKASDENGLWSDDNTKIEIEILPPLYRSWWAYLIYFSILCVLGVAIFRIISNRIKLKNELKISLIEKEKAEEFNQVKLRYFTNISHELLTPLTIIMLQIESLHAKINNENAIFETIKENVIRLKRLIKQILVFRKTDSGSLKLCVVKSDIVDFVKNICNSSFQPLIREKQIDFRIDTEHDQYLAYFDPDKLDKIIYNLLSNAFKYTKQNGIIALKMTFIPRNSQVFMRLSIADNGSGIAEEDLPYIFDRFYISNSADQSQSHGIGLSLTKELVSLHKGFIQVKSTVNEGTVFTIEIPLSEESYDPADISEESTNSFDDAVLDDFSSFSSEVIVEDTNKLSLLVVEDNPDLNEMIVNRFSDTYSVHRAFNGVEALVILKETDIDLIISDVMMPLMDGLTLCKVVKNDLNTSHINFLMLTAKNSTEDRIDCYNAGADAYISKPFEMSVLYARVHNLIVRKRQKNESFQQNHEINISSMEYSSIDETFLKSAITKVEEFIEDSDFDFERFALEMCTSKATLHRKITSLTGLAPGEFIRNIRMKHAIQMFDSNVGNISEVAYAVGYNDPKYFSKCFKVEFGITPREYLTNKSNKQKE